MSHPRKGLLAVSGNLVEDAIAGKARLPRLDFFGQADVLETDVELVVPDVEYDFLTKLQIEREMLGAYISGHPTDPHHTFLAKATPIEAIAEGDLKVGQQAVIGGVLLAPERLQTRGGKAYCRAILEDQHGFRTTIILWPESYAKYGHLLEEDAVFLCDGKVAGKRDEGSRPDFHVWKVKRSSPIPKGWKPKPVVVPEPELTLEQALVNLAPLLDSALELPGEQMSEDDFDPYADDNLWNDDTPAPAPEKPAGPQVSVTLKGTGGFDAPWIVVRGSTEEVRKELWKLSKSSREALDDGDILAGVAAAAAEFTEKAVAAGVNANRGSSQPTVTASSVSQGGGFTTKDGTAAGGNIQREGKYVPEWAWGLVIPTGNVSGLPMKAKSVKKADGSLWHAWMDPRPWAEIQDLPRDKKDAPINAPNK